MFCEKKIKKVESERREKDKRKKGKNVEEK